LVFLGTSVYIRIWGINTKPSSHTKLETLKRIHPLILSSIKHGMVDYLMSSYLGEKYFPLVIPTSWMPVRCYGSIFIFSCNILEKCMWKYKCVKIITWYCRNNNILLFLRVHTTDFYISTLLYSFHHCSWDVAAISLLSWYSAASSCAIMKISWHLLINLQREAPELSCIYTCATLHWYVLACLNI
jgi:hypothetical protein